MSLREMADMVRDQLPSGYGLTLFVAETDRDRGMVYYISTVERPSMIRVVELWLDGQRKLAPEIRPPRAISFERRGILMSSQPQRTPRNTERRKIGSGAMQP